MEFVHFIHAHHLSVLAYGALFFGMVLEATAVLLGGIFLTVQGILSPVIAIPILIAGALTEQLFLYAIGFSLGSSPKVSRWVNNVVKRFDPHMIDKTFRTIVISKFLYGLHRAVLIRAGMLKIPIKTFIQYSFTATFIWLVVYGVFGFVISLFFSKLKNYIKYAEFAPLVVFVLFFVIQYGITKLFQKSNKI